MNKIAIDARMITNNSMHGIARYVYNILLELNKSKQTNTYYIFCDKNSPLLSIVWSDQIKPIVVNCKWMSFWQHLVIPRLLKKYNIDLYHAPSFIAPIYCPCTLVMTVHDLNHIALPHFYTIFHVIYYYIFVRYSIKRSALILTVSLFSKKEIIKYFKVPENKIQVTYNGVSKNYEKIVNQEYLTYIKEIYELPEKFILSLSNNKPHKNVVQLVYAYCKTNLSIPLVLACSPTPELIYICQKAGKKHLVHFIKFIEEAHLPAVYNLSHVFVYPSTYEGFGLPPLEALACDTPVLVSNCSSLPEVLQEHAIYSDAYNYHDLAEKLVDITTNSKTRENIMKGSLKHIKKYSWKTMTEQTITQYNSLLKKV